MIEDLLAVITKQALNPLVGLRLRTIACSAMFRMFSFSHQEDDPLPWALHVDCPWRMDREGEIITGGLDWAERDDGKPEEEDWSPQAEGNSLQEAILRRILQDPERKDPRRAVIKNRTNGFVVESIETDQWGGCVICMSPGYRLVVFPDSGNREAWRFFKKGDLSSHFVIPVTLRRGGADKSAGEEQPQQS